MMWSVYDVPPCGGVYVYVLGVSGVRYCVGLVAVPVEAWVMVLSQVQANSTTVATEAMLVWVLRVLRVWVPVNCRMIPMVWWECWLRVPWHMIHEGRHHRVGGGWDGHLAMMW